MTSRQRFKVPAGKRNATQTRVGAACGLSPGAGPSREMGRRHSKALDFQCLADWKPEAKGREARPADVVWPMKKGCAVHGIVREKGGALVAAKQFVRYLCDGRAGFIQSEPSQP